MGGEKNWSDGIDPSSKISTPALYFSVLVALETDFHMRERRTVIGVVWKFHTALTLAKVPKMSPSPQSISPGIKPQISQKFPKISQSPPKISQKIPKNSPEFPKKIP